MAISKKRIYELTDEQTTLTDTDLGVLDKLGYDKAKKFSILNLYNYVKAKLDLVYQTILVSGTDIKTINGDSILGSGDLVVGSTDKNIATNDLVFTANSSTDFAGYTATFDNATLSLDGELILGDAVYSRLKLNNSQAGKQIEIGASVANYNTITFVLGGTGEGSGLYTNAGAWFTNKNFRFDTSDKANIYVNNGGLGLGLNGRNGLNDDIFINNNGYVKMGATPIYASDGLADADSNLPSGGLYKLTGNRTIFQKP